MGAVQHATKPPATLQQYNKQLTFKPNLRPGVPNFEALWAKHKADLLATRQRLTATVPQPFQLTPSAKDEKVVGRRLPRHAVSPSHGPRRAVSLPVKPKAARRPSPDVPFRGARSSTKVGAAVEQMVVPPGSATAATTKADEPATAEAASAPRGTRAHAMRTEAIYSRYVNQDGKEVDKVADDDSTYWREVAQRRKEVARRLAPYVVNHHAEHEQAIEEKVKALRAAQRDSELAARERLSEMKARVSQMPPVFAEPTQLNEASKARAEAEQHILESLRETGLDGKTIQNILASAAASNEGSGDAKGDADAAPPVAEGEAATDSKPKKSSSGSSKSSNRYGSSDFSSSSGNSSSSSSDSSSSSAYHPPKKPAATALQVPALIPVPVPLGAKGATAEYSDDSFESSSDSD